MLTACLTCCSKTQEMLLLLPKQVTPHMPRLLVLLTLFSQVLFVTVLLERGIEQGETKYSYSCLSVEI